MKPSDYLDAARVPHSIKTQEFGLWRIGRIRVTPFVTAILKANGLPPVGWKDYTLLYHVTEATMHLVDGEVVMEDSLHELRKHLPIWLAARGRVLITGLGLGCVVRGLLANPDVEHVDVVEIDRDIIRIIGAEFVCNPRVTIHHHDALTWQPPAGARWDFAWHDLWTEDNEGLQHIHGDLIKAYFDRVGDRDIGRQGAWNFPRVIGRRLGLLR